jgi:hypothetical protein
MSGWWGFFFGKPAPPTFTEDKTQFLDFFPNTCADCRNQSTALFNCLSAKSAEHLKSTDLTERKEAGNLMKAECQNELIAYNECMLLYFHNKKSDTKYKAFRVRCLEEYAPD